MKNLALSNNDNKKESQTALFLIAILICFLSLCFVVVSLINVYCCHFIELAVGQCDVYDIPLKALCVEICAYFLKVLFFCDSFFLDIFV